MLRPQQQMVRLREEVESLAKVANMANVEAQQASLRVETMEHDWLAWGEGAPEGGLLRSNPDHFGWRLHQRHSLHRTYRLDYRRHISSAL